MPSVARPAIQNEIDLAAQALGDMGGRGGG